MDVFAGLREKPVWRDGLSSTMSYLIMGVKNKADQYNCVCARFFGHGHSIKVKFYPNLSFWGVSEEQLKQRFHADSFLYRPDQPYMRCRMTEENLKNLLEFLANERGMVFAKPDMAIATLEAGYQPDTESEVAHPTRGSKVTHWVPSVVPDAVIAPAD